MIPFMPEAVLERRVSLYIRATPATRTRALGSSAVDGAAGSALWLRSQPDWVNKLRLV
jgi:hypothetical protein